MDFLSFGRKKVLVIGDVMLDTYFSGSVNRISPEAPVPVFKKECERSVMGGAANVAANLVAAGQEVSIMSIIGDDEAGEKLVQLIGKQGIDTSFLLKTKRETTVKTRFIANSNQQVLRLDIEDTSFIKENEVDMLSRLLREKIQKFDLILISDYLKGLLSFDFTQLVIRMANENGIRVLVDVKDPNYDKYKGCFLLKPNLFELKMLTGMEVDTDEKIIYASRSLLKECNCNYVLTTAGARGMILVGREEFFSVSSVGKEVFDVTGAGDTTISYLAACLVNDFKINDAVEIANYAAGIQVAKVGTSIVHMNEVKEFIKSKRQSFFYKSIERVDNLREQYNNKKIVFTNGCFDILHVGHVRYLQEAAKLGDILVVGLNSDKSVRKLKGLERPINTEDDRAEILRSLGCVDYVILFDEDTPYELIGKIQPDILVKGGDYKPEDVVGKDIVEARGGEVRIIGFVKGKSSTNIIEKIKNNRSEL